MPQSSTILLRRLGLGLAMLGVATGAHAELGNPADNSAACCQLTTSLVNDVLRGSDVSGDEKFFSAEGAPPNIHFLLDTSGSMQELPQVINSKHSEFFAVTTNGCDNPRLDADALARGWDPSHLYDPPDMGTGLGSDAGFPNLFQDSKFYGWMQWGIQQRPGSSVEWRPQGDCLQRADPRRCRGQPDRVQPLPHVPDHQGLLPGAGHRRP
jgi:type IV pilus assembly protein PilY1